MLLMFSSVMSKVLRWRQSRGTGVAEPWSPHANIDGGEKTDYISIILRNQSLRYGHDQSRDFLPHVGVKRLTPVNCSAIATIDLY